MKNLLVLLLALSMTGMVSGQVKFNLNYQPETGVYTVSVVPETTWPAPRNKVGAAQIVLRVAANVDFTPSITSLVAEAVWADNAYVEHPASAPDYTFVCITLASGPTDNIVLTEGQELPLFSFTNAGGGCPGLVELVPNDDPMVLAVREEGFNVTQHLAVLGARGNAFSGVLNGAADCVLTSGTSVPNVKFVEDVQVTPVPAVEEVTLRWTLLDNYTEHLDLVVCDNLGREVYREKVSPAKGENTMKIQVKNWKSGVYRIGFQFSGGRRAQAWNLVVIH